MRRRSEEQLQTPISSLIDVVFLLIIFFVVTASVEKDVVDESIRLAQAKYVKAMDQEDPRTVTVNVDQDGSINIALQPLTLNQLQQILSATRQQTGDAVPVVIRSDGRTLYEHIDDVVGAIGRAGLHRVKLSAVTTEETMR